MQNGHGASRLETGEAARVPARPQRKMFVQGLVAEKHLVSIHVGDIDGFHKGIQNIGQLTAFAGQTGTLPEIQVRAAQHIGYGHGHVDHALGPAHMAVADIHAEETVQRAVMAQGHGQKRADALKQKQLAGPVMGDAAHVLDTQGPPLFESAHEPADLFGRDILKRG